MMNIEYRMMNDESRMNVGATLVVASRSLENLLGRPQGGQD
jgi:hypothetical protein